jgi:hypothetical protein
MGAEVYPDPPAVTSIKLMAVLLKGVKVMERSWILAYASTG